MRDEGVQGVLTLFCSGAAQVCYALRVEELKEQLEVEEEDGDRQEEEEEVEGKKRVKEMRPSPYLRISTSRLMETRLDLGPAGSPTGGGNTCAGGTSGAGRRIRAAGSARRRSQGSPLTASSNSMSHASVSGTILIARAGCTPSGVPMA